jgi:hypothetical protein
MIRLAQLLQEIDTPKAGIANLVALNATGAGSDTETVEDLSFKFRSKKGRRMKGVLIHDIITIDVFNSPGKENIQLLPYHLIFGESSMAIFDAFATNEVAGLKRSDCQAHLDKLAAEGKTEADDAFIAGLVNFAGKEIFQFINVTRASIPGFINRILPHESLHMARYLITLEGNEWMRNNLSTPNWWEDDRAVMVDLTNDNEEYFAEVLERINAVAYDRWAKAKGLIQKPVVTSLKPLSPDEYKTQNIKIKK